VAPPASDFAVNSSHSLGSAQRYQGTESDDETKDGGPDPTSEPNGKRQHDRGHNEGRTDCTRKDAHHLQLLKTG
jgi:hypothetical protein